MEKKGLDAYQLKIIALIFMILDHVHSYLFYGMWPRWISLLPRFVAPLFLYLMVEGFFYTRSRKKYAGRLFLAAAVMWAGNAVINFAFHNVDRITGRYTFYSLIEGHNIFLTLALLFCFIWALESICQKRYIALSVLLAVITAAAVLFCEGGVYLMPIAIVFYALRNRNRVKYAGIILICVAILAKALLSYFSGGTGDSLYVTLCFDAEWAMIAVIPFIIAYNGKRGRNTAFSKRIFYIIYPLHLWMLMILAYIFIR